MGCYGLVAAIGLLAVDYRVELAVHNDIHDGGRRQVLRERIILWKKALPLLAMECR